MARSRHSLLMFSLIVLLSTFLKASPLSELLPNGTENTAEQLEQVRKILKDITIQAPPIQSRQQGDILLNVRQATAIANSNNKKKSRSKRYSPYQSLWNKSKPIYYTMQRMHPTVEAMIRAAAGFWTQNTCLNFVEHPWASPRLRFLPLTGCWSSVGRQTGWNSQDISIGYGCQSTGNAAHEIAHALGFYHTQSRPDRDYYVSINFGNVPTDKQKNFVRFNDDLGTSKHVGYDFGSVLQYGPYAFAKDLRIPTVLARDWRFQSTMGRREYPSFGDVKAVNMAYGCHESCNQKISCNYGGFVDSRNCNKCQCPPYFSGSNCQGLNRGTASNCNSVTLTATSSWSSFRGQFSATGSGTMDDCNWLIQAPSGRRIKMKLTNLSSQYCEVGCTTQGVEFNTGNFDVVGMRFCCNNQVSFTSDGSLMTVRGTARTGSVTFDVQYTLA